MREYWWINTRARDMLREAFAAQLQGDQAQNITAEERRQSLESQLQPQGSPAANAATCCVLACIFEHAAPFYPARCVRRFAFIWLCVRSGLGSWTEQKADGHVIFMAISFLIGPTSRSG
jgi:hypothetical protein